MKQHPTAAKLEGLVAGGISARRSRAVIAHLLRGCGRCSARLSPHLQGLFGLERRSEAPPFPLEVYDEPLDRAFAAVQRLGLDIPAGRTPEQKQREALALLTSGGLEGLHEGPPDLQGLPVYEALLERSWALRYEDPDQMVKLARCAALLADQLSESEHGVRKTADLRCRAWMELGNAYRVADELNLAAEALARATDYFILGSRNESLGARFFDVLASQYAARRAFDLACSTLEVVVQAYQQSGDQHLEGRALIMKGIFTGYQGNPEEAVDLIQTGLSSVDGKRDPGLVFSALQIKAWLLVDCGRFRDARLALWELWQRELVVGRLNELKVRWLEGRIYVGLNELDHAGLALRQVKEGFEEAGLEYKAALAGLELGAVWLRQSRFDKATEVVLECTEVFLSLRIQRELMASILLLQKASAIRSLTLSRLESVIAALRKAEQDPIGHLQPAEIP